MAENTPLLITWISEEGVENHSISRQWILSGRSARLINIVKPHKFPPLAFDFPIS